MARLARVDFLLPTFVAMLVLGGISEEVGWRGFALPRLRGRFGSLISSLILGLLWGFWHRPAYTLPALGSALPISQFLVFALTVPVVTILFTWLAENNRGNLTVAFILHASPNASTQWPSALHLASPGYSQIQLLLYLVWALLAITLPRP